MEEDRREGGGFEGGVAEVEEARREEADRGETTRMQVSEERNEEGGVRTHDFVEKHQVESEDSNADLHVCSLDVLLGSIAELLESPEGSGGLVDSDDFGVEDERGDFLKVKERVDLLGRGSGGSRR